MKIATLHAAIGSASLLLLAHPAVASAGHRHAHLERRLMHRHGVDRAHHAEPRTAAESPEPALKKRATCSLPEDSNLVVVPGASNGGFAMSPDQTCQAGMFCPIACKPGMVMNQWDPQAKAYTYPMSMVSLLPPYHRPSCATARRCADLGPKHGGLLCGDDGQVSKPFPDRDFCTHGTGAVSAQNEAAQGVAFCQTVLPGNEAMLIPTLVAPGESVAIAVPGETYWAQTSAQ